MEALEELFAVLPLLDELPLLLFLLEELVELPVLLFLLEELVELPVLLFLLEELVELPVLLLLLKELEELPVPLLLVAEELLSLLDSVCVLLPADDFLELFPPHAIIVKARAPAIQNTRPFLNNFFICIIHHPFF